MTLRTINREQLTGVSGGFDFMGPLLRWKGQSQEEVKAKIKLKTPMSSLMSGPISGGSADSPKKK